MNLLTPVAEQVQRTGDADRLSWQEVAQQIETCNSLFVEAIGEVSELQLVVVLIESKVQPVRRLKFVGIDFGYGQPVEPDETSRRFHLEFDRRKLVTYTVTNESYSLPAEPWESYTGRLLRLYTRSHILNFARASTQYFEELWGTMLHFQLVTQNQIIDVVTSQPPTITPL